MATVKLEGLPQLLKALKEADDKIKAQAEGVIQETAQRIASSAKQLAASSSLTGSLVAGIKYRKNTRRLLSWQVVSSSPEGHLVEFGTGTRYKVPKGMKLGRGSRATGKRHSPFTPEALKNIAAWAAARGLPNPEEAARSIAVAISRRGGLRPRPYMFPAAEAESGRYRHQLESVIKRTCDGFNQVTAPAATGGG